MSAAHTTFSRSMLQRLSQRRSDLCERWYLAMKEPSLISYATTSQEIRLSVMNLGIPKLCLCPKHAPSVLQTVLYHGVLQILIGSGLDMAKNVD